MEGEAVASHVSIRRSVGECAGAAIRDAHIAVARRAYYAEHGRATATGVAAAEGPAYRMPYRRDHAASRRGGRSGVDGGARLGQRSREILIGYHAGIVHRCAESGGLHGDGDGGGTTARRQRAEVTGQGRIRQVTGPLACGG